MNELDSALAWAKADTAMRELVTCESGSRYSDELIELHQQLRMLWKDKVLSKPFIDSMRHLESDT